MEMIKDLIPLDKPREKLKTYGRRQLTNQELLAIIINSGNKDESALTIANRLLQHIDSFTYLRDITLQELIEVRGIGEAKAITILAMIEIATRLHTQHNEEKFYIKHPDDVELLLMERLRYVTQEEFVVLYLTTKNMLIHEETIFKGSLNTSIVHPREVFKDALKRSAAAIIVVHNHPSGDPTPSKEDIRVTKRLNDCGALLGIDVLDHIIIGDGVYYSLKEHGHF